MQCNGSGCSFQCCYAELRARFASGYVPQSECLLRCMCLQWETEHQMTRHQIFEATDGNRLSAETEAAVVHVALARSLLALQYRKQRHGDS
jgi:hypothetical protein